MSETATEPAAGRRPLAVTLTVAAGLCVLLRLLAPSGAWYWHLVPVGAMSLFAGARLRSGLAFALPLAVMALTDAALWGLRGDPPFDLLVYGCYLLYALFGRLGLAHRESPLRVGGLALLGSAVFFLITNFGAWLTRTAFPAERVRPAVGGVAR